MVELVPPEGNDVLRDRLKFLLSRQYSPLDAHLYSFLTLLSRPVPFSKTQRFVRPGQEKISLEHSLNPSSGSEWLRDEQMN